MTAPAGRLDARFSEAGARAVTWGECLAVLDGAESSWIVTVQALQGGRVVPHVVPLLTVLHDQRMYFCTGEREQKAVNLSRCPSATLLARADLDQPDGPGVVDVTVTGPVRRVLEPELLETLAARWRETHLWGFEASETGFRDGGADVRVFAVESHKVIAFTRDPAGQTTFDPPLAGDDDSGSAW